MSQWSQRQQLMSCLFLSESLWRDFADWRQQVVTSGEEAGFGVWVDAIAEYYTLWGRIPDMATLQTIANNNMQRMTPEQNLIVMRDCNAAAQMAIVWGQAPDMDSINRVGRQLLTNYLRERVTERVAVDMQSTPRAADGLLSGLQQQLSAIDGLNGSRFKIQFPNGDFKPKPPDTYQITQIGFLNTLLGGGLVAGEVVGHAAPIGSGKTTLVMQVAYGRALDIYSRELRAAAQAGRPVDLARCPRVYVFVYEQVENLMAYHISNAANIPRATAEKAWLNGVAAADLSSCLEDNYRDYEYQIYGKQIKEAREGREPFPYGELERFRQAAMLTDSLISFADFSGHDADLRKWSEQGETGMVHYLRAHQDTIKNVGVNFVALDYAGAMVDTGVRAGRIKINDVTSHLKMVCNNLGREIGGEFACPIWAAQQLSPDENQKAGGTIPNPSAAAGSRMFLEYASAGIASGKLTKENIAVYVMGKQRRVQTAGAEKHLAKLSTMFARWEEAHDYTLSESVIMPKNEVSHRQIPNSVKRSQAGFGGEYGK